MSDLCTYTRDEIEDWLPGVWDQNVAIDGLKNDHEPDPDMPKGPAPDPSHLGGQMVAVADLKRAWERANLTLRQRQVLLLRYGLDSLFQEIALDLGIDQKTVREHHDRGIENLGLFLNGRPFTTGEEIADAA